MKDLKDFDISFIGIKDGMHQFEYEIDNKFFDFFNYDEFYNSKVKVVLSFLKKPTMFELTFNCNGWVEVDCDLTGERFHQPIDASMDLIVKFGDEYNDENEELVTIPHADYKMNVAQYMYEAIVLTVPIKRIHPGVSDGTLQSDVLDKLRELEVKNIEEEQIEEEQQEIDAEEHIDPRWDKLKNILIEKNKSNGTS